MSNSVLWFLTFVIGVALGVLVSPLIMGTGEAQYEIDEPEPVAPRKSAPSRAGSTKGAAADGGADTSAAGKTGTRTRKDSDDSEFLLSRALQALPTPDAFPGEGRITGMVKTDKSKPVAGVEITAIGSPIADRRRGRRNRDRTSEPDLEEVVRKAVKRHRFRAQNRRVAISEADGSFVLYGISAELRFEVSAKHDGYQIRATGSSMAKADESVDFVATQTSQLRIRVVRANGSVPEQATVVLRRGERGNERGETWYWAPDESELELRPGKLTVHATVADEELASDEVDIQLEAGETHQELTLTLGGRLGIKGQIIQPEGEREKHLHLQVTKTKPGRVPEGYGHSDIRARVKSDFTYLAADLKPGTYYLSLSGSGRNLGTAFVDVVDGMVEHDFVIEPPADDEFVIVWVRGPEGEPLADVQLTTGWHTENSSSSGGGTSSVMPDGSYRVFHHDSGGQEGSYSVTARTTDYGQKTVSYQRTPGLQLSIDFEFPAELTVTVAGYAGSDYEDHLSLSLVPAPEEGEEDSFRFWRDKGLDENGVQELGPVPPGKYILSVNAGESRHDRDEVASHELHLTAGANQFTVPLPVLCTVTVIANDLEPGTHMTISPRDEGSGNRFYRGNYGQLNDSKQVVFENVVAGKYTIRARGGASSSMNVIVNGTVTIYFEAQEPDAMAVTVHDPEGYLASVGLKSGDLIVGLDGQDFESLLKYRAQLLTAASNESDISMVVSRSGTRLSVTVAAKRIAESTALGGYLRQASR